MSQELGKEEPVQAELPPTAALELIGTVSAIVDTLGVLEKNKRCVVVD